MSFYQTNFKSKNLVMEISMTGMGKVTLVKEMVWEETKEALESTKETY